MEHVRRTGYLFAAVLSLIGVAVFAAGAIYGSQAPEGFAVELAKGLLTLGSGLILGGAVKAILDLFQGTAKVREEEHLRLERVLADLREVHDRTESVRLLVAAHRSAQTYGEQMRSLIDAQVLLLKVKRTLDVSGKATEPRTRWLANMLAYLGALHVEYRDHYKEVSDCQRYDEEVTALRIHAAAEAEVAVGEGLSHEPLAAALASGRGWSMLEDKQRFPVLADLISRGSQYQLHFFKPFHHLAADLLNTKDGAGASPNFDGSVEVITNEIRSICTAECGCPLPSASLVN